VSHCTRLRCRSNFLRAEAFPAKQNLHDQVYRLAFIGSNKISFLEFPHLNLRDPLLGS